MRKTEIELKNPSISPHFDQNGFKNSYEQYYLAAEYP